MRSSGFLMLRGKGRGGGGGGSRGGGRGGRGYGRAPSSYSRPSGARHYGKNQYQKTITGHTGRPGTAGNYSWKATYGPGGKLLSVSRGYGMAKGNTGQYGQAGTNRGSYHISGKDYLRSQGRNNFSGGGASAARSVVSGDGGGGSAGGSGPGGGTGDGPNTPGAAAGPFRIPRERESRARARAEIRGSRALATRRALKIGSSGGSSVNTGRRGGSGVQV